MISKENSDHIKKCVYRWFAEHCLILLYKIVLFYVLGQEYQKSIEGVGGGITDAEYVYQSALASIKIIVWNLLDSRILTLWQDWFYRKKKL